jgi:hypothetical protein
MLVPKTESAFFFTHSLVAPRCEYVKNYRAILDLLAEITGKLTELDIGNGIWNENAIT